MFSLLGFANAMFNSHSMLGMLSDRRKGKEVMSAPAINYADVDVNHVGGTVLSG